MIEDSEVLPADDPKRDITVAYPDGSDVPHLFIAGDTYTLLLSGTDTAGKMCLIDMHVPPGGGPGPHRHDFEETFTVLEGEVEVTFRGEAIVAKAGETVHIPANAPHLFTNAANQPARMLCVCEPAGQDEFFRAVGVPVDGQTSTADLSDEDERAQLEKAETLASRYDTELLTDTK
jgi:quercetin dioxygenase-like cupin family protein